MDFKKFLAKLSDRGTDVLPAIEDYLEGWGCDLKGRKPKQFEGEDGTTTMELDLPALIMELVKGKAVINIPTYVAAGPRVERSNEVVLSAENRHGEVCAPSCHKHLPNLGLLIRDANVIKNGEVGAPRAYNFCGADGEFRDESSWQTIEIFGADDKLADEITLTSTVNPGRWSSVYGRPYLMAKAAVLRLQDESKHYGTVVRRLRKEFPVEKVLYTSQEKGAVLEIEVQAFETELDGFEMDGEYPTVEGTLAALEQAEQHLSGVRAMIKRLNFPIRVSEAAFIKHGLKGMDPVAWCNGEKDNGVEVPVWCFWGTPWETGYKQSKRHKNAWARREMAMGFHLKVRAWNQKVKLAEAEAQRIQDNRKAKAA
jgi:hypothetical protein